MALCIDKNRSEYQNLLKRSGVPDFILNTVVSYYLENYGRYPRLNEIPNSDSSKYLKSMLDISKTNTKKGIVSFNVKKDNITQYLNIDENSNEETILKKLQEKHSDLSITIKRSIDGYSISYYKYPTKWSRQNINRDMLSEEDANHFNIRIINNLIDNTLNQLGRKVIKTSDLELSTPKWKGVLDSKKINKAFIFEGNIYINTDHATIDDPIHELLHMFIGALDNKENRELYEDLLSIITKNELWYNMQKNGLKYNPKEGLTERDFREELLVSQLAKHFTGQDSIFRTLDNETLNIISERLKLGFDKVLYANISAESIPDINFFTSSLKDIFNYLGSGIFDENNFKDSTEHRITSNIVLKLLKSEIIREECNG